MSYGALFNFIITPRGQGKSFGFKKICLKDYLYKKEQFVLLRRTDIELKDAMDKFFNDMTGEFPGYGMRVWKDSLQIIELNPDTGEPYDDAKWETAGYGMYLSNARRKKSISYDGVTKIIFDEFMLPANDTNKYLKDEVNVFLDAYETIARTRNVRVFFLANSMSRVNPYFLYWHLEIPKNNKGIRRFKEDIVVDYSSSREFESRKKITRFGKIVSGTDFEKYAILNEFVDDNEDGIEKKDKTYQYSFTIHFNERYYGVYYSGKYGLACISEDYNRECVRVVNYDDRRKYDARIKTQLKFGYLKGLKEAFYQGCVRYENEMIKYDMWELFRKIF